MFTMLFLACTVGTLILVVGTVATVVAEHRSASQINEVGRAFLDDRTG